MKKIRFIINPISGTNNKKNFPEIIETELDKTKFDYEIVTTKKAGDATSLAQEAREKGYDIVVAVGGDGTINEVARALVHSNTALGIIPCGSGNGLARHMLLPMDVKKAIAIINECQIHAFDYGLINDHPFFVTCGMGFDAVISMKFAKSGKRGPITYVQKVLEEGVKYKPETYEIYDENGKKSYKAFLISCANASQYGNNAVIAPNASMSDGLMDFIIMEPFDLIEASQISIDMFNKTLDNHSKIKTFQCKKLTIRRSKPGVIHYDGEPIEAGKEINIELKEQGINIIYNPFADKSQRKPNAVQRSASELFNEINVVREDISRHRRYIQVLGKMLQRKLNI